MLGGSLVSHADTLLEALFKFFSSLSLVLHVKDINSQTSWCESFPQSQTEHEQYLKKCSSPSLLPFSLSFTVAWTRLTCLWASGQNNTVHCVPCCLLSTKIEYWSSFLLLCLKLKKPSSDNTPATDMSVAAWRQQSTSSIINWSRYTAHRSHAHLCGHRFWFFFSVYMQLCGPPTGKNYIEHKYKLIVTDSMSCSSLNLIFLNDILHDPADEII